MKVIRYFNILEDTFLVLNFGLMCVVVTLQVIFRYFLNSSLTWSEELTRYLFTWMIYIGSSYCVRYKCHIRLDFFVSRLPAKFSRAIHIGTNLIIVLVVFAMVPACIATVMDQIAVKSSAMEISMALVFAAVPVGLVSTAVRILAEDVQLIREAFRKEEA